MILNQPVMKNDFPLNNDFKAIIMITNELNYKNKQLKRNYIDNSFKICSSILLHFRLRILLT